MSMAVATLKKGEGRTLKAGGLWVFDNEIESVMGDFEDGDIVVVHGYDDRNGPRLHQPAFQNPYSYADQKQRSGD